VLSLHEDHIGDDYGTKRRSIKIGTFSTSQEFKLDAPSIDCTYVPGQVNMQLADLHLSDFPDRSDPGDYLQTL
jgi:hypothetical protein